MIPTETPSIKGTGSSTEQKPATIVYHPPGGRDPRIGAATHHIVTSDEEVHVYLGERSEGIDSTLPLDRCEIHRTDRGRETFGADVDVSAGDGSGSHSDGDSGAHAENDGPELVTDGGRPRQVVVHCEFCTAGMSVKPDKDKPDTGWKCNQCRRAEQADEDESKTLAIIENADVEPGDSVNWRGCECLMLEWDAHHTVKLVPVGLMPTEDTVRRKVDVRELEPVETDDNDPEIVTDGGRDIPPCTRCGADLLQSVEMGTTTVGRRRGDWSVRLEPTATCECGASIGADLGQRVVQSLIDELGDPLDDDGDGDAESVEVEDERTAERSRVSDERRWMIDVRVGDRVVVGSGKGAIVKAVRTDPVEIDVARLGWSATITSGWWECSRCGRLSVEPSRGGTRTCSVCIEEECVEQRKLRREEHGRELQDALMKDPDDVMMLSSYDCSDDGGDVNGGDD